MAAARHRVPNVTTDPFLPELEQRLTNLSAAGFDAAVVVRSAAGAGPLPDDHPAAALWWRILDQLPQTPSQAPPSGQSVPTASPSRRHWTGSHRAALGTASRARPEPLKPRFPRPNAGASREPLIGMKRRCAPGPPLRVFLPRI